MDDDYHLDDFFSKMKTTLLGENGWLDEKCILDEHCHQCTWMKKYLALLFCKCPTFEIYSCHIWPLLMTCNFGKKCEILISHWLLVIGCADLESAIKHIKKSAHTIFLIVRISIKVITYRASKATIP